MPIFYGTIEIVTGVRATADIGAQGLSGVLIGNESGLTVIITMQGNNVSKSLYPGSVDWFPVGRGFNGIIQIDSSTMLANASTWPSSFVQIDTYGTNETPGGVYPMQLARANNIGNTIATTGGSTTATNLVNDAVAAGQKIIEARPIGESSSVVTLTNDGVLTLGNGTHHGQINSDDFAFQTDGNGNLFMSGKMGSSSTGLFFFDALTVITDLILLANAGDFQFQSPAGTEVGRIKSTGILSLTNTGNTTFTGPTTGNVKFYLFVTGTIKILIGQFNGYQNNTATRQTFTFPGGAIISSPSFWISTDIPGCQGFLSGVGNTINIFTTLAAAGGGITNQNNLNKNSIGYHQTSVTDSLKDTINDATVHNGQIIAIGF